MQMTVGWIYEGNLDRFLAARYATPQPERAAELFQCPFCGNNFPGRTELSAHVAGEEPGTEETIRTCLTPRLLEAFNCTGLSVAFDGEMLRPVRLATLARQLTGLRRANIRLQLFNAEHGSIQPVVQEYHLRIMAPDEESLAKVDRLFLSTLDFEDVNLDKVGRFYEATRDEPAAEYAEALADYVRAVLIKDRDPRTGVSRRLSHYHEIQNRALNILQSFDRPLANLLSAIIRFALNDFSRWQERTGFESLDYAYSVLGPLAQDDHATGKMETNSASEAKSRVFICPVDVDTDTVTRLAKEATDLKDWNARTDDRFSALANQASRDAFDRAKIYALWAVSALRHRVSAGRPLQSLDGNPTFENWANRKLAEALP
jgi:hypothetical protein